MPAPTLRPHITTGVAVVGAGLVVTTPVTAPALPSEVKTVSAQAKLLDTETVGLVMGGSGTPIPSPDQIGAILDRYNPAAPIFPGQPLFPVDQVDPVFTPEGLYPATGVKSLELDPSVAQGATMLTGDITREIAAGHNVVTVGISQSAIVESLTMRDLLALPADQQPAADQLSFLALVDPSAPDGGILERFNDPNLPLTAPAFGITFSDATPAGTPWDTAIYDQEYDGFSDFPRYPIDLLSDINAALGIAFVHSTLTRFTDEQIATAVKLPVSADYTGHTEYFILPTQTLPLLQPLESVPVIGQPLYDLLEPDMRILVNLGYGSITEGWDQGPANVPTPFTDSLFPTDIDPPDLLTALAQGAQQGFSAFESDLSQLSLSSLSAAVTGTAGGSTDSLSGVTDAVNNLSGQIASLYTPLLPVADAINTLLTTVPAYNIGLFAQELSSGDLLDAIGMPIALDFGLAPVLLLFGIAGIS